MLNTKLSINSGLVLVITIQMSPLWALYVKNWRRNSQKSPKKSILQDGCFSARPKIDYYLDPGVSTKVVLRTVRYRHTVHKVRYHANSCLMWWTWKVAWDDAIWHVTQLTLSSHIYLTPQLPLTIAEKLLQLEPWNFHSLCVTCIWIF